MDTGQRNETGQFVKGNTQGKKPKKRRTPLEMFEKRLTQRHPTEKATYSQAVVNKLIDLAIEGDTKALLKVVEIMDRIESKNNPPKLLDFLG